MIQIKKKQLNESEDQERYELISRKDVEDFDGFNTEYSLYFDHDKNNYFTVFGDSDIYGPEDDHDADFGSNEKAALEWMKTYKVIEDEEETVEFDDDDIEPYEGGIIKNEWKFESLEQDSNSDFEVTIAEVDDELEPIEGTEVKIPVTVDEVIKRFSDKSYQWATRGWTKENANKYFQNHSNSELAHMVSSVAYDKYESQPGNKHKLHHFTKIELVNQDAFPSQEELDEKNFEELRKKLGKMLLPPRARRESVNESEELDRHYFASLVKLGDKPWDGYSILNDGYFVKRIHAEDDDDAIKQFRDWVDNGGTRQEESVDEKLIQSDSQEAFEKNLATEIKAGKPQKQALAIAYSVKRKNESTDFDPHGLQDYIKDWYIDEYDQDDLPDMYDEMRFSDLVELINKGDTAVFHYLPLNDTIRDRIFEEIAKRYGITYSEVLDAFAWPEDSQIVLKENTDKNISECSVKEAVGIGAHKYIVEFDDNGKNGWTVVNADDPQHAERVAANYGVFGVTRIVPFDDEVAESLSPYSSDGWSVEVADRLEDILNEFVHLRYEILDYSRGAVTDAKNVDQLIQYCDKLKDEFDAVLAGMERDSEELNENAD